MNIFVHIHILLIEDRIYENIKTANTDIKTLLFEHMMFHLEHRLRIE